MENGSDPLSLRVGGCLSHACHTDIDETGVFVGTYTIVETWCDHWKTECFAQKKIGSGGGT